MSIYIDTLYIQIYIQSQTPSFKALHVRFITSRLIHASATRPA
jgi:hypothetical protein